MSDISPKKGHTVNTLSHLTPLPDELAELPLDHVPPLHVEMLDHLGVEVAVHIVHHAITHHLISSRLKNLQRKNDEGSTYTIDHIFIKPLTKKANFLVILMELEL